MKLHIANLVREMDSITTIYSGLTSTCRSIQEQSIAGDNIAGLIASHNLIEHFESWADAIAGRPEQLMLKQAIREFELSILANIIGLYNLSFTGLRFFFERSLTAILFSSKEIDLRLWMKGARDTYWNEIIDSDSGIFSHNFSNAFFPELKEDAKHFGAMAKKVYRECSEYVHGNISTHSRVPHKLSYSQDLVTEWHEKADTIKDVVIFALCLRYLGNMEPTTKAKVETSVMESLSHVSTIRAEFVLPH